MSAEKSVRVSEFGQPKLSPETRRELLAHAEHISGTGALARHASGELVATYEKHAKDAMQVAKRYNELTAEAGKSPQEAEAVTEVLAAQKQLRDGLTREISHTLSAYNQPAPRPEPTRSIASRPVRNRPPSSFVDDVMNGLTLGFWSKK